MIDFINAASPCAGCKYSIGPRSIGGCAYNSAVTEAANEITALNSAFFLGQFNNDLGILKIESLKELLAKSTSDIIQKIIQLGETAPNRCPVNLTKLARLSL